MIKQYFQNALNLIIGEAVSFITEGWWTSDSFALELQHSGEGVQEMCHQCRACCNLCHLKRKLFREGNKETVHC